jgi:hypothetical protein
VALASALLLRVGNVLLLPGFGVWLLWEVTRSGAGLRACVQRMGSWALPVAVGILSVITYNVLRFGDPVDMGYGTVQEHLAGKWWVGLYGLLFSPGRSMFVYAPMLVPSTAGIGTMWRTRRQLVILLALLVVPYIVFHSRLPYWDGGGCWSPRYLTTILPFMMFGLAALLDKGLSRAGVMGVAALALVGVVVQLLGMLVPCVPYAGKMLADAASADRLIWHAEYSPLAEHARAFIAREYALWIAPNLFNSHGLAWLQFCTLACGLVLLGLCVGRVRRAASDAPPAAVPMGRAGFLDKRSPHHFD